MKKFLTLISICAAISCTLCSCGSKNATDGGDNPLILTTNATKLDDSTIKPINDYFDGLNQKNNEIFLSSFTPKVFINEMKEKETYERELSGTDNDIESTHAMWTETFGENSSIEFIEQVYNAPLSEGYLNLAKKYFEMTYYDLESDFEITEGYEISFKYKISGDKTSEESTETACLVNIKDDGWKLIFCSSEVLLSYQIAPENTTESAEIESAT